MILVKKCIFFLELFSVKIRLEIMFNNVIEGKETFWSKNVVFFLELFSVKIRREIMFNNVLERKETFFGHKKCNLPKSQKSHFSKGVNPCFW